ncbi:uncharacterized protein N7498_005509 [Penicillium cinerascens]|uniref:Uncharacterized protein n=1 Tax=Penicillium cinerascens TaxID=70096 RepID=A0A9W9MNJ8_9EURO|nr:uncharacterized protein N7498_005509 [Penicillium cinerascens]KAJ5204630.1 hypothetical protein N7498_005509 [Penicillium cinerascens]
MDLQGTPLPHGNRSTKVTNDPLASQQPIEEPSGPVASDSLAAQSIKQGGGFSENRGAEPMGVSGNKSTLNNTDTSAATELPPAPVGGLREDRQRQEKYPEALGGQGNFPGAHHSGYVGGPTAAKKEMGMNAGEYSSASGSGRSQFNGGQAPSYVNDITPGYQHSKPAGRNIHEGGFEADDKNNASFNSEIGSDQDPARAAINKFQRTTAESGPDAGGPRQSKVDNQHPFQALDEQRA